MLAHISIVNPFPAMSSDAEFGMSTYVLGVKESALDVWPDGVQATPWVVPSFALTDESLASVPEPSSNEYAATKPWIVVLETVTATFVASGTLPRASLARAESVWAPLAAIPVLH